MALMHWEPFREIESMQRQMNRLFDQLMSSGDGEQMVDGMNFIPAAEVHETEGEVNLHMELPGIDPKDLDVQVSAEAVSVKGERKSEVKTEDKGLHRSEFRYGRFQRVIPLPAPIQNDKVQADFNNGVLSLTMPKSEDAKRRVVKVNLPGKDQQGQLSSNQSSMQ